MIALEKLSRDIARDMQTRMDSYPHDVIKNVYLYRYLIGMERPVSRQVILPLAKRMLRDQGKITEAEYHSLKQMLDSKDEENHVIAEELMGRFRLRRKHGK